MSEFIPYGRQSISEEDIEAVVKVLKSDFLTQGPVVPAFEKSICDYTGAKYGVAVNSATSALHIACLALGVGPGDIVWTSPITFVASANCALYCGASVDFVDIDPRTFNLCPVELEKKLEMAKAEGKLPKVVIPVHMAGQSCEMEKIYLLSKKYGFKLIEDASHAIGGKYKKRPVGSCDYSDITVFSFHPVKIITTAEGGLATTNDPGLHQKMSLYRTHGITRDESLMTDNHGPWYYEQLELGYNYRMTEIQAALGLSQMKMLDSFVEVRNKLAEKYTNLFSNTSIKTPEVCKDSYSSFHLYIIQLDNRDKVFANLRENNIGVNLHYIPVHMQPFYKKFYKSSPKLPVAENYYQNCLSLPLFSSLKEAELERVFKLTLSASSL